MEETIKADVSKLTFGDLELLDRAQRHELPIAQEIELLDRIVVGGVRKRRLTAEAFQQVLAAAWKAVSAAMNPEDDAGKN